MAKTVHNDYNEHLSRDVTAVSIPQHPYLMTAAMITALIGLVSAGSVFAAEPAKYRAEWSEIPHQVCDPAPGTDRRPVIFDPVIIRGMTEVTTYWTPQLIQYRDEESGNFNLRATPARVRTPARVIYMKEQHVGYIDPNGNWVDRDGDPAESMEDFDLYSGDMDEGTKIIATELEDYEGRTDEERWDSYLQQSRDALAEAPDCTTHIASYTEVVDNIRIDDFGSNNPMICALEGGVERSVQFNEPVNRQRRVMAVIHGGIYLAKLPGGEIKLFYERQTGDFLDLLADPAYSECQWTNLNEWRTANYDADG